MCVKIAIRSLLPTVMIISGVPCIYGTSMIFIIEYPWGSRGDGISTDQAIPLGPFTGQWLTAYRAGPLRMPACVAGLRALPIQLHSGGQGPPRRGSRWRDVPVVRRTRLVGLPKPGDRAVPRRAAQPEPDRPLERLRAEGCVGPRTLMRTGARGSRPAPSCRRPTIPRRIRRLTPCHALPGQSGERVAGRGGQPLPRTRLDRHVPVASRLGAAGAQSGMNRAHPFKGKRSRVVGARAESPICAHVYADQDERFPGETATGRRASAMGAPRCDQILGPHLQMPTDLR